MRGLTPVDVAGSLTETLRLAAAHERLVFLCSFQKEESVILDELLELAPHVRVVTIDTGVLFAETLDTWRAFEARFGVRIDVEEASGKPPWTGPAHCCGGAKVAALDRALAGADAWITGLRREQGPTRAATERVEVDVKRGGIAKYSPLAHWTERDLWQRIYERDLPYHPLHDAGYESIGCAPCTQPGNGREGRWAGTDKTECGLHVMDPMVIAFGLGVGILIGLTGIGGGSLMTPLLVLFAGVPPVVAIGTDLAYGAVTKTLGGWRHLRKGTVDLGVSGWLAIGSVPGALFGVWLLDRLHAAYGKSFEPVLLITIAGVLLLVAVTVLGRALFMPKLVARERHAIEQTRRTKVTAVVIGAVLGVILGVTSVGSGALVGLALILVFQLTPHRVVGTDVFHAAILLWAAALAHLVSGNVDFLLMATILVGSLPGVLIGTQLITRVPANGLRPVLGCVLLGSGLGVLKKAGVDVPPAMLVGVPVAIGVGSWWLLRERGRRTSRKTDVEVVPA